MNRMTIKTLLLLAGTALLTGCVTTQHAPLKYSEGFEPIYPVVQEPERPRTGSLFTDSKESLVGRAKTFRVGDIITVLLNESAQAKRSQNSETKREAANTLPRRCGTENRQRQPVLGWH